MVTLSELQKQADELSAEEREGLISYLLEQLPGAPLGPDDAEVDRRDQEMDSGTVAGLSHEEFRAQVGRR